VFLSPILCAAVCHICRGWRTFFGGNENRDERQIDVTPTVVWMAQWQQVCRMDGHFICLDRRADFLLVDKLFMESGINK
jgi:hypothetical protein